MIKQKAKTQKANKYLFFIGSNNQSHKPEPERAREVLKRFKIISFTLTENLKGFWNNEPEQSFKIEIIATKENPLNDFQARAIKTELEKDLKQFLVLTEKTQITLLS